ncbi:MAG TPA: CGNR zinc finger domain-containing protein [Candidatus Acidoferrum sp.]|jgi:predicted RNA-binding Zn ribbon-like protein|nr:CGNR zinc finger domain-containing protein [Candidatus Acidoferrum sp.]
MIHASHQFRVHKFGQAAPWVDLANSEMWDGYGHLTDFLDDPQWISDFLEFWRFRVALPGPAVLRELRKLRKLSRHFAEKTSRGAAIQPGDLEALNSWLKVPVIRRLVENQNGLQFAHEPVQIGWPAVMALIADSLAEALSRQMHDRLKICANTGCTWVFVDRTKGRVKRWCSDATCGNRDRVRRSRAAHKS